MKNKKKIAQKMGDEIRILSRNPSNWIRQTKTELHPIHRNIKPERNPLETVREYQRALNAQKLERVMAKPFVAALEVSSEFWCKTHFALSDVFIFYI